MLSITGEVNRSSSVDEIATKSLQAIGQVLPFDLAFFLLVDHPTQRLHLVPPHYIPEALVMALEHLDLLPDFFTQADDDKYGVYALSPLSARVRSVLSTYGHPNPIILPLMAEHRGMGVLTLARWPLGSLHQEHFAHKDFLDAITTQVGLAVQRTRLMERLRASEEKYRTFIEENPDGFWEQDITGCVTLVNRAALEILGYPREEIEGRHFPSTSLESAEVNAQLGERLRREGVLIDQRVRIRARDGTVKTLNETGRVVRDLQGMITHYQFTFRDVTARVQMEEELARRNEESRVLSQIASVLSYPLDATASFNAVCEQIASLTGMESVAILLLDAARPGVNLVAHQNLSPALLENYSRIDFRPELFSPDFDPAQAPGLPEFLLTGKKTFIVQDLAGTMPWDLSLITQAGFQSGIGAALRYGDEVFGVMLVGSRTPRSFDAHDSALIENIALRLAISLRNKALFEQLQRQVAELKTIALVGELLAWSKEPDEALHQVACQVAQALVADKVAFMLPQGEVWHMVWSSGTERTVQPVRAYHREILSNNLPRVVADRDAPDVNADQRQAMAQLGASASLGIPLVAPQTPLGILFVDKERPHQWTTDEIRLASTLGRQVAAALYSARLLRETRARVRELESFAEMSALAASLLGETTVIDLALDAITDALGVDLVGVHLLDGERFRVGQVRGAQQPPTQPLEFTPMLREILRSREPLILDSQHVPPLDAQAMDRVERHHAPAVITMPLLVANGAIGILSVAHVHEHVWSQAEILLIKTIANELATAIQNGRLYREQIDRAEKLKLLMELSTVCSATLQLQALLQTAVEQVRVMLSASQVSIRLVQGEYLTVGVGAGYAQPEWRAYPIKIDEQIERTLASQQPLPIPDLARFPGLPPDYVARKHKEGAKAVLCAPMVAQGEALGMLAIFFAERHEWSQAEIQFTQTIASTVAVAVSNARLYESLQQEQRDTEMILNSVFSGVFTTDREGNIETWNRAAVEITGLGLETLRGQNWTQLARVGRDQPDLLIMEAMEEGEIVFGWAPRTLKAADGHAIPLGEAAAPLRDAEGKIRGAVGAFWDRTKERQAERAKRDFLAEVSHELRNSLTVVLSMAQLLRDPKAQPSTRGRAVEQLANEVERLQDFSNRFLNFEHAQGAQPLEAEPLNLAELLHQTIAALQLKYPQQRFRQMIKTELVYADRARLQTVLSNLLDNAAKFSTRQRPVSIEVISIPGGLVRVAIRNYGPTIPSEAQAHLFERGFRVPLPGPDGTPVEGNGLGLWLVKTKLRELGGEICLNSDEQKGTIFYFTLQEARGKYEQEQIQDSGRGRRPRRGRRIGRST